MEPFWPGMLVAMVWKLIGVRPRVHWGYYWMLVTTRVRPRNLSAVVAPCQGYLRDSAEPSRIQTREWISRSRASSRFRRE